MKKIVEIAQYLIFIAVPILYYGLDIQPNFFMDVGWIYSFAMLTKAFIMKVLFKEKYCEIDLTKRG